MISEEQNSDDDCDSGNDEPSDYLPLERRASMSGTPQQERAEGEEEEEAPALTRYICRLQIADIPFHLNCMRKFLLVIGMHLKLGCLTLLPAGGKNQQRHCLKALQTDFECLNNHSFPLTPL